MTDLQHDLIKRMSTGKYYLAQRMKHSGRMGYMLYTGEQNPIKWYSKETVRGAVSEVLKKDKHGKLTLNLNLVRQQHGKSLLKQFYKLNKTQKNHGIRSNKPEEKILF